MYLLKYIPIYLMFIIAVSAECEIAVPSCDAILNDIENNLPHVGILKNSDGFVYVDVDDGYIHNLITWIQQDGFEEPPYFGAGLVGAHITVIYPDEIKKYGLTDITECGEQISFVPKDCQIVYPPRGKEIDEVYFVVVESPQLDQIRKKYGLTKREYVFHITIGVKATQGSLNP